MLQTTQGPTEFRALLARDGLLTAPGVYDGLSAKIAEAAGVAVLYISGGAIARSMGYPDIGLVTLTEMQKRLEEIRAVTTLPLIVDADTGYGNALNVIRTVRAYARSGAAALHIEDQVEPKRCGHYEGKQVVGVEEMVRKIQAAVEAGGDGGLVIIARTDARAVLGLDAAIERGNAYAEAGADMIFVEAPQSVEEIERIALEVKAPARHQYVPGWQNTAGSGQATRRPRLSDHDCSLRPATRRDSGHAARRRRNSYSRPYGSNGGRHGFFCRTRRDYWPARSARLAAPVSEGLERFLKKSRGLLFLASPCYV